MHQCGCSEGTLCSTTPGPSCRTWSSLGASTVLSRSRSLRSEFLSYHYSMQNIFPNTNFLPGLWKDSSPFFISFHNISYFIWFVLFLFYVYGLLPVFHVCLCTTHIQLLWRPEDNIESPRTRITNDCEVSLVNLEGWHLNNGQMALLLLWVTESHHLNSFWFHHVLIQHVITQFPSIPFPYSNSSHTPVPHVLSMSCFLFL